MANELVLWMDGEWLPESQGKISIFDDGFLRADAAFDAARTFNGAPFQLEDHVDRLLDSCRFLELPLTLSKSQLVSLGNEVAQKNKGQLEKYGDFWIDYHVTRGVSRDGYKKGPGVMVYADPIPFKARAPYFKEGIAIVISGVRHTPPWAVSPRVKSHNYLNFVIAKLQAKASGGWPILLDERGNLTEGNSNNIFLVKEGKLYTPHERYVLPGITRNNVMELAKKAGISVLEADLDLHDLYLADEVFLTSTSLGICSVSKIDGRKIEGGIPGPVTAMLVKAYNEFVGLDTWAQYLKFG